MNSSESMPVNPQKLLMELNRLKNAKRTLEGAVARHAIGAKRCRPRVNRLVAKIRKIESFITPA